MPVSLNELKEETIYLTLGSITDVQDLFKGIDVKYTFFNQPTTEQIRDYFRNVNLVNELFNPKLEVVIIVPAVLEGTGLVKPITKHRSTKKTEELKGIDRRLPTDQYLRVPAGVYCFVICADIDDTVSKATKAAVKKIEGGIYQILDLTSSKLQPLSII